MKNGKKMGLLILSAVAALIPNMALASPTQQRDTNSEIKAERRAESKLASNQYYNVNAPYLEPAYAPAPGVVNTVMRAL